MSQFTPAAETGDRADRLARRIGEVLPSFIKLLRHRAHALGLPAGLTWPQVLVVRAIGVGEAHPSALARHFLVSGASITSLIDGLVQKGLVDRRHDERDRRTVCLTLTDAGRAAYESSTELLGAVVREAVATLPADRQDRLLLALDDLEQLVNHHREGESRHGCAPRAREGD